MKISTRGRYGLKAMVDLAVHSESADCISLKSIAQRQAISEHYLEQLFAVLKKADFVKSVRGAQGGYILNKSPADISVGDLLRTLEGTLDVADCVSGKASSGCKNADCLKCVTKSVWEKISYSITEAVDSITLSELVDEYRKNNGAQYSE